MNQPSNHTNGTQSGSSFPSQQSNQSNPFASDLKGEFNHSNFGTNSTNAMSQIFKDGSGFGGQSTSRWILIGLFLVVAAGAGYFFLSEDSDELAAPTAETTATESPAADAAADQTVDAAATEAPAAAGATAAQTQPAANTATGNITLATPVDGDARPYDETSGPARFSWEGGAGTIVFSRHANMNPVYMRVPVSGSSYNFYNPYPGTWYWKVENGSGASEVRKFTVEPAARRAISVKEPAAGGSLAANGGTISWNADPERKVAFYRVEFSTDGKWTAPAYRFASSGESAQTQGMNPGAYQMRLGAFSEVAGRWEFTEPLSVTVQ